MRNNGFQILENKQHRTVIPQKENKQDKSGKCFSSLSGESFQHAG